MASRYIWKSIKNPFRIFVISSITQTVQGVAGKAGDGLCDNQVHLVPFTGFHHGTKLRPGPGLGTGNTLIGEDAGQLPVRMGPDERSVMVYLGFVGCLLLPGVCGNPAVGGTPLKRIRSFRCPAGVFVALMIFTAMVIFLSVFSLVPECTPRSLFPGCTVALNSYIRRVSFPAYTPQWAAVRGDGKCAVSRPDSPHSREDARSSIRAGFRKAAEGYVLFPAVPHEIHCAGTLLRRRMTSLSAGISPAVRCKPEEGSQITPA